MITNAALFRIGEITHDIEINYWREKRFQESRELSASIETTIANTPSNPVICIEKATPVFDTLYDAMRDRLP